MERKEKKADLEQLLNSLIEKGGKPFGRNYCKYENWCLYYIVHTEDGIWSEWRYWISLRELTSKESWLWQFVCENGMIKENNDVRIKNYQWDNECDTNCCYDDYEYRLIESALKDESELEDFLLSNIKVEWIS